MNKHGHIKPIELKTGKNGSIRKFWPGHNGWHRIAWGRSKTKSGHFGFIDVKPTPEEQQLINAELERRESNQVEQINTGKRHLRVVA